MLAEITEGTVILKEDETNANMYKILKGHAELYVGYGTQNETILGILSKGDYFGELGMFTGSPSIYTVVAYSDMVLNSISMREIDSYIKNNPRDIVAIMKNMSSTMYNLKLNIELLIQELSDSGLREKKDGQMDYLAKQIMRYNLMGTRL